MQSLPLYSEPALGCPAFSASPDRGFSRFSAGEMLTLADNFLQKQQKQQDRSPPPELIDDEASRSYFTGMRMVGLKRLKNKLSEYVRLVAAGERIVVTDRNRVVAEIVPPRTGLTPFEEQGVREGWLRPARIRDGTPPPRKPVKAMSLEQLMADLERDREDR
jgi:prevent-host-death family protein